MLVTWPVLKAHLMDGIAAASPPCKLVGFFGPRLVFLLVQAFGAVVWHTGVAPTVADIFPVIVHVVMSTENVALYKTCTACIYLYQPNTL